MIDFIKLKYETNALEPYIDATTVDLHYNKHHKGYVDKLNGLIAGTQREHMSLVDIVTQSNGSIFNNAGQILNHNLYRDQFAPNSDGSIGSFESISDSNFSKAIVNKRGSYQSFIEAFSNLAVSHFGSGRSWFYKDQNGNLEIINTANGDNPITKGYKAIIGIDIREHAYYLKYQNRRAEYLQNIWNLINWNNIEAYYNAN